MNPLLDNIFWHALAGPHARFADGAGGARRYAAGFSPIVGFADPQAPDFAALRPCCKEGERFYCDGWTGACPDGWRIVMEGLMTRMLWQGELPPEDAAPDALALTADHAEAALELATLTRPGPFGLRTIELGDYFGYFEGGRLAAMAGERMQAPGLREISGVCTHPDFAGRGMARRLVLKLVRRQLLRGETPFLNVMSSNELARGLYRRLGFADYRESVVRVVTPDR